jgi:hypothetical protein
MEAILARRFSSLNFSVVPGFPNVVHTIDEWGDFLPKFREHRDDSPIEYYFGLFKLLLVDKIKFNKKIEIHEFCRNKLCSLFRKLPNI